MARKRKSKSYNNDLHKVYFNPRHPASFGGKSKLIHAFKNKIKHQTISEWLSSKHTYTLHKTPRKKFPRRKYIVHGIDALWQCDLTDLPQLAKYNNGIRYILVVIDVFSRWGSARVLKSKSGVDVASAFADIMTSENRTPDQLQTDKGKEFLNTHFKTILEKFKIHHYVTENQEIKASFVERLQRTIKSKMFRYFTHTNSYRYIDVIQDLFKSYNDSVHSSTGMKPNNINYKNQEKIWQKLYYTPETEIKFKFNLGDRVRISKYSTVFAKGYLPAWSEEIFTVAKRHFTDPPVYSLKDDNNSQLTGTWYEPELQKVNSDDGVYKIESILGKRKLNGRTQYLVRWKGYPPSFDSYVDKSDIIEDYKN